MSGWSWDEYAEDLDEADVPEPSRMDRKRVFPLERPTLQKIKVRYNHICNRRGQPYWNYAYLIIYPEEDEDRPSWNVMGCLGPKSREFRPRNGRPYVCRLHNFCAFCWERRRRQGGLRAALHHTGQENVIKFSLSLPGVRTDVETVKEARKAFVRFLKRNGFDRITCYIHTFGENPAEGPKGHLDGIVSGADGDIDVLHPSHVEELRNLLLKYHHRPDAGFWEPTVKSRPIVAHKPRPMAKELVLAGFYAGRPTFHTRRVLAGMYGEPGDYRVRMTNMGGKSRKKPVMDLSEQLKRPVPDWSWWDLLQATQIAENWDKAMGRPVLPRNVRLETKHLDAVIAETGWRGYYRMDDDETIREKYALGR